MKKNRFIYGGIAFITAIAGMLFVVVLIRSTVYGPGDEVAGAAIGDDLHEPPTATTTAILPSRLIVPAIGVDANIQHVGVTASGNMATPRGFVDVGWYKYGTIPGNKGSAVIAGHVDNGLALAGVFKHLVDIKPGSDIYVVDTAGQRLHFQVDRVESYDYTQVPLDSVFKHDDRAHLNLITCDGLWIGKQKTYDRRLVVYASFRT